MAYKLQLKRGLTSALPTGSAGEPLFTTDTNDLYIGTGSANQRYQKYIASGTSSQFLKGDGSLDSNTYYLASNPSAYIALTALTASSPLFYNNTTGAFTIAQASGSANGYLSSTDWTTFNNKQNALTNPVTGTGTTNQIPKFSGSSTIANSNILDNGTDVIINSRTSVTDANGNFVTITPNDGTNTRIEGNANKPLLIATSGASLKLAAGGVTPQVTLTSTGLGIGTTSPLTSLNVRDAGNTYSVHFSGNDQVNGVAIGTLSDNVAAIQGYTRTFSATNDIVIQPTAGNLGLKVTPNVWTSYTAFQINTGATFAANTNQLVLGSNWYYNSGDKYVISDYATLYVQNSGQHKWFNAPSGTAGAAMTLTQAMTLDASGRLGIGATNPIYGKVQISGGADNYTSGLSFYQGAGAIGSLYLKSNGSGDYNLILGRGGSDSIGLTIAPAGAATFSSSVTTGSPISIKGTTPFIQWLNDASTRLAYIQHDASNLAYNADTGAHIWIAGGSERLRITSGGDVGIGCTPFYSKLQIRGSDTGNTYPSTASININNYESAAFGRTSGINFSVGNGSSAELMAGVYGVYTSYNTSTGGALAFITNNGSSSFTEKMRITSGGTLLLGTTSADGVSLFQANGFSQIGSVANTGYQLTTKSNYNAGIRFFNNKTDNADVRHFLIASDVSVYGDFAIQKSTTQGGSTYANLLYFAANTGAATFSSTLGINGVADSVKSGTYTPTLTGVYNVASSTAYELQYMRVGNVVTVSGYIQASATAANTWTRISITLPISSTFDYSYRAGGGGGASATNNVCAIQAGAFGTSVVYLDSYPNTTSTLGYTFSFTYLIM